MYNKIFRFILWWVTYIINKPKTMENVFVCLIFYAYSCTTYLSIYNISFQSYKNKMQHLNVFVCYRSLIVNTNTLIRNKLAM